MGKRGGNTRSFVGRRRGGTRITSARTLFTIQRCTFSVLVGPRWIGFHSFIGKTCNFSGGGRGLRGRLQGPLSYKFTCSPSSFLAREDLEEAPLAPYPPLLARSTFCLAW